MGRKPKKDYPAANETLSRLLEIMELRNVKPQELCRAIGVASSTYTSWLQRGKPPGTEQMSKILQYLHADANYVMGITDTSTDKFTESQREILKFAAKLTPAEAMIIQGRIYMLIGGRYCKEYYSQAKKEVINES